MVVLLPLTGEEPICQAAIQAGYRLLFSEDMTSEQVYDRVIVLNPFDQGARWIEEDPPRLHLLD